MISISDHEFDQAVEEALELIPDEFRPHLDNVVVEILPRVTSEIQREHDVPEDVLGLYVGVPLEEKGPERAPVPLPDRVLLFREPLRAMCGSKEQLIEEIRVTVLHEIGHHFGLDEDHLAELGYD